MALMICPECGGQVSDKAHTCPHCGYPIEELMAQGPAIPEVCLYEYKGQTYDVTDIVRTLLSGDRGEAAGILWELLDLKREEVTMVLSGIENQRFGFLPLRQVFHVTQCFRGKSALRFSSFCAMLS